MKKTMITAAVVAILSFAGCDWQPVEACDKRGQGLHSCQTVYVPPVHHFR